MMVAFIDDHRQDYGVEPICAVLPIAPSTYYAVKAREADPALRSARARSDEALRVEVQRVWDENRHVYGAKPARLGGAGSGSNCDARASSSPGARSRV